MKIIKQTKLRRRATVKSAHVLRQLRGKNYKSKIVRRSNNHEDAMNRDRVGNSGAPRPKRKGRRLRRIIR